jgi:hypothetical protein
MKDMDKENYKISMKVIEEDTKKPEKNVHGLQELLLLK